MTTHEDVSKRLPHSAFGRHDQRRPGHRARGQAVKRAACAIVLIAAGAAYLQDTAVAAGPSNVSVSSGTLKVSSPAGVASSLWLERTTSGYQVRDTAGTLAAGFPCTPTDSHTVKCPSASRIWVSTGDYADAVRNTTGLPGWIYSGDGNDFVSDGAGSQWIDLGNGDDASYAGTGADHVTGGYGRDSISYSSRITSVRVTLDGLANDGQYGEGDNVILETVRGGKGNDYLIGNSLANSLSGDAGNDYLSGGDGDDWLHGGLGNDAISGGYGTDVVSYSDRYADLKVRIDNLANDGQSGELDNVYTSVENVYGGSGADLLVGSWANNKLYGNGGNDWLYGQGGTDLLVGGAGMDSGSGGDGTDTCDTEAKTSTCER